MKTNETRQSTCFLSIFLGKERGGIGMGNTCKPMAVSFQCMTKFTTKKKTKQVTPNIRKKKKKRTDIGYATPPSKHRCRNPNID